jgi:hypothetical protein
MPPPKVDGAVQLSLAASNVFGLAHIGDGTAERIGHTLRTGRSPFSHDWIV